MRQKFNYLFIGLLFSGLAFFSYLFLLLYSEFTPQHLEVLISFKSFILILAAFNLVGFGVLMIHNWQKRSFQFLVKRKERLIIDCILTATILFLMNLIQIIQQLFQTHVILYQHLSCFTSFERTNNSGSFQLINQSSSAIIS